MLMREFEQKLQNEQVQYWQDGQWHMSTLLNFTRHKIMALTKPGVVFIRHRTPILSKETMELYCQGPPVINANDIIWCFVKPMSEAYKLIEDAKFAAYCGNNFNTQWCNFAFKRMLSHVAAAQVGVVARVISLLRVLPDILGNAVNLEADLSVISASTWVQFNAEQNYDETHLRVHLNRVIKEEDLETHFSTLFGQASVQVNLQRAADTIKVAGLLDIADVYFEIREGVWPWCQRKQLVFDDASDFIRFKTIEPRRYNFPRDLLFRAGVAMEVVFRPPGAVGAAGAVPPPGIVIIGDADLEEACRAASVEPTLAAFHFCRVVRVNRSSMIAACFRRGAHVYCIQDMLDEPDAWKRRLLQFIVAALGLLAAGLAMGGQEKYALLSGLSLATLQVVVALCVLVLLLL